MTGLLLRLPRDIARVPRDADYQFKHCWGHGVSVLQIESEVIPDHPQLEDLIHLQSEEFDTSGGVLEKIKRAVHGTAAGAIISSKKFGVAEYCNHYFLGAQNESERRDLFPTLERFCSNFSQLDKFSPGDIISISLQLPIKNVGGKNVYLPIDISSRVRRMLNELTKRGLIVFIAAGNSNSNLDRQRFTRIEDDGSEEDYCYFDKAKKSLSVKVGYSINGLTHSEVSNHGRCVSFFAPAHSVETACYDNRQGSRRTDILDNHSLGFCRSSAATPLIAGMAACIQSYALFKLGTKFGRNELLEIMRVGAFAREGHHPSIGVFPNLRAIFEKIDEIYSLESSRSPR